MNIPRTSASSVLESKQVLPGSHLPDKPAPTWPARRSHRARHRTPADHCRGRRRSRDESARSADRAATPTVARLLASARRLGHPARGVVPDHLLRLQQVVSVLPWRRLLLTGWLLNLAWVAFCGLGSATHRPAPFLVLRSHRNIPGFAQFQVPQRGNLSDMWGAMWRASPSVSRSRN